jgi:uncharacterized protein YjbI with pentapeptide repeats
MGNKDHLSILKRGVDYWNRWRRKNRYLSPDLSKSKLRGTDLRGANLRGMDLSWADLRNADLRGADLRETNLSWANARGADLSRADMFQADMSGAELTGAKFFKATLSWADMPQANLTGADFGKAVLFQSDLSWASLCRANFSDADLRGANFTDANLSGATLTGAKLWETQICGWTIKGIICELAFWDRKSEVVRKYGSGEFEAIYSEKPAIVLHYENGITPIEIVALPGMMAKFAMERPGCLLRLKSIQQSAEKATVEIVLDEISGSDSQAIRRELEDTAQQWQGALRNFLIEHRDSTLIQNMADSGLQLMDAVTASARISTSGKNRDSRSPQQSTLRLAGGRR